MPYLEQQVTSIDRLSDNLFTFTTTRPKGFSFKNGEFVTIGLRPDGKLIPRAYSIVSTNRDDYLEFLSIEVKDGPLTRHLAKIQQGSSVWINTKCTGSLTIDHIQPGRNLFMLATGTGLAPFMSLIRGAEVFQYFEHVVLVHSVRTQSALAFRQELESINSKQFFYVPTVTRQEFNRTERGADLFRNGTLAQQLNLPEVETAFDRVMLCGNPNMNKQMKKFLIDNGWTMTNYHGTGNFALELAFVD